MGIEQQAGDDFGADVVGEVAADGGAGGEVGQPCFQLEGIAVDDVQAAPVLGAEGLQHGEAAGVGFDSQHVGAAGEKFGREGTGAGADFGHISAFHHSYGIGNAGDGAGVIQEMLAEFFGGGDGVHW